MRLLLVEDDQMVGDSLQRALGRGGLPTDWIQTAEDAELALKTQAYDILLVDLGLPGKTGLQFLEQLRQAGNVTPVLILTAQDDLKQRVAGLDAGADDYLVKPFALEELEARIRAVGRRKTGLPTPVLTIGPLSLDTATKQLTFHEKSQALTAKEYLIVHALMARQGLVLSRADLEQKLYDWNTDVASNTIEVHVHQLRKKFGDSVITNIRGLGYRMGSAQ